MLITQTLRFLTCSWENDSSFTLKLYRGQLEVVQGAAKISASIKNYFPIMEMFSFSKLGCLIDVCLQQNIEVLKSQPSVQ